MTDQRDKATIEPASGVDVTATATVQAANLSRRALLRGATIAAPAILSLSPASAALAASSVRTYTSTTAGGEVNCLAEKSTLGQPINGNPNALQVGSAQTPVVYNIPERNYVVAASDSAAGVTEQEMCRNSDLNGTTYFYPRGDTTFQSVSAPRGILMSAAAMGSLGATVVSIDNL